MKFHEKLALYQIEFAFIEVHQGSNLHNGVLLMNFINVHSYAVQCRVIFSSEFGPLLLNVFK